MPRVLTLKIQWGFLPKTTTTTLLRLKLKSVSGQKRVTTAPTSEWHTDRRVVKNLRPTRRDYRFRVITKRHQVSPSQTCRRIEERF